MLFNALVNTFKQLFWKIWSLMHRSFSLWLIVVFNHYGNIKSKHTGNLVVLLIVNNLFSVSMNPRNQLSVYHHCITSFVIFTFKDWAPSNNLKIKRYLVTYCTLFFFCSTNEWRKNIFDKTTEQINFHYFSGKCTFHSVF